MNANRQSLYFDNVKQFSLEIAFDEKCQAQF